MQLLHEMHVPLFTHCIYQSECLFQGKPELKHGVLSAAYSVAIGSQYMKGIRYVYTRRVLLTVTPVSSPCSAL